VRGTRIFENNQTICGKGKMLTTVQQLGAIEGKSRNQYVNRSVILGDWASIPTVPRQRWSMGGKLLYL
jgi:hypothetical protein